MNDREFIEFSKMLTATPEQAEAYGEYLSQNPESWNQHEPEIHTLFMKRKRCKNMIDDKLSRDAMVQAIEMLADELSDEDILEIANYADEHDISVGEAFHRIVEIGFDEMDRNSR